ncbi:MAG: glucosaminidase domain-containing protein, partial [Raoultibacter sp.]
GKWYYYDPYQGYMHRGSSFVNGNWYRYDPDSGCMMTGLVGVDGRFYWYDIWGGQMLYGWLNLFGCPCHFNTEQGYLDEGDPAWLVPYSLNDAVIAQVNKGVRGYTYNDYAQYMDPAEIFKKNINSLQFMRLDGGYSGVTAEQLNAYIANNCTTQEWNTGRRSTLRNIGSNIVQVSKETGVNEVYILAHAIWESQWGCSKLAAGKVAGYEGYYNFYGIGAYDFDPLNGGAALAKQENWTTPALAIQGGAKWITKNYLRQSYAVGNETVFQNTLYNMRFAPGLRNVWHQYATGINWAQGISTLMLEVYNGTGVPLRVSYEVPVYS